MHTQEHRAVTQPLPATSPVTFDLPADAVTDLSPWLDQVLTSLQPAQPQLTLADLRLGALTEAVGNLTAGTPVVQLTAADGPQLLAPETAPGTKVGGNYVPKKQMLGNPMLLALGKQLGMALGKSLLKKADPALYKLCFGESTDEIVRRELGNLKQDLKDYLQELRQEDMENEFIKVRGWLRDIYSVKLSAYDKMVTAAVTDTDKQELVREANAVYNDLDAYQKRMQELAEVIETRLSDAELATCSYQVRLKVNLHRLAFMQRLVLVAAQIYWRRILNGGKPAFVLEEDFKSYATDRLVASTRMVELMRQGRYSRITQPYHLNYAQRQGEGHRFTTLFDATHHWYAWRDDFESDNPRDPFKGTKMYEDVGYALEIKLPFIPLKNEGIAQNKAQQDRDAHFHDVERLFDDQFTTPLREAKASVTAGLDNMNKLSH